MKSKKLKVGFVGSGNTAKRHAEVVSKFKNYNLSGVYSRKIKNAKNFAKKFNINNFYDDIHKFKKNEYDLIIFCLPPEKLLCYLKYFINLKTNIFVEKPLGLNLIESKKILKLFKNRKYRKMKFFVGYNRRFLGSVLKLKKIISNQSSIRYIEIKDQQDTNKAKSLGHDQLTIKNWMFANSIHTIDFFVFLLRGKLKIFNKKKIQFKNSYIITCNIISSYGDFGRYIGYWNIPSNWSVSLINDQNILNLSPLEEINVKKKHKNIKFKNFVTDKKFKPGFYNQFKEIDNALNNKKNYAVTIFDAIKSVQIIDKIYEKSK